MIKVKKLRSDAIIPQRHDEDVGLDLTVTHVHDPHFADNVVLYGTGLSIIPPRGFYVEIVARSSIAKLGHYIPNSLGVIDPGYRGELFISLSKTSPNIPDLVLPARIAQLIVRPLFSFNVEESDNDEETTRGTKCFGST